MSAKSRDVLIAGLLTLALVFASMLFIYELARPRIDIVFTDEGVSSNVVTTTLHSDSIYLLKLDVPSRLPCPDFLPDCNLPYINVDSDLRNKTIILYGIWYNRTTAYVVYAEGKGDPEKLHEHYYDDYCRLIEEIGLPTTLDQYRFLPNGEVVHVYDLSGCEESYNKSLRNP